MSLYFSSPLVNTVEWGSFERSDILSLLMCEFDPFYVYYGCLLISLIILFSIYPAFSKHCSIFLVKIFDF
jgi:hypothetical protein